MLVVLIVSVALKTHDIEIFPSLVTLLAPLEFLSKIIVIGYLAVNGNSYLVGLHFMSIFSMCLIGLIFNVMYLQIFE